MMQFDWEVHGESDESLQLDQLRPVEVLYDFDGPHVFVFCSAGRKFLANLLDQAGERSRFLIAPTSENIINELKTGLRSLLEALNQPWIWVAEVDGSAIKQSLWHVSLTSLPAAVLPEPGLMLYPHLEPLISARLVGGDLRRDTVSASVIKRAVDGVYKALKVLAQTAGDESGGRGRATKLLRQLYDLPTQRVAFGSFEIAFMAPRPSQKELPPSPFDTQIEEIGGRLNEALSWVERETANSEPPSLDLLESLESLIPPQHGLVEEVHIHGRLLPKRYVLDREASARLRTILARVRNDAVRIITVIGIPEEFDKPNLSFRLPGPDGELYRCSITEEHYDVINDAFYKDAVITVTLKTRRGYSSADVLAVAPGRPDDAAAEPSSSQTGA
ncbi:MAG: hypothetical protein H7840_11675 [Alphaproteobacteria bacterium]